MIIFFALVALVLVSTLAVWCTSENDVRFFDLLVATVFIVVVVALFSWLLTLLLRLVIPTT